MRKLLDFLRSVLAKFFLNQGMLHASALAYSSALGVVPVLALIVIALNFWGLGQQIETLVLSNITGGNAEVMGRLSGYLHRVNLDVLGWMGFGSLLVSGLLVIDGIETSFNVIWEVKQGRSLLSKIVLYPIFAILCPSLLLLSSALAAMAQLSQFAPELAWVEHFSTIFSLFGPLAAKGIAFAALYFLVPNQRVRIGHALAGGAIAAVLWHVAEWGFFRLGIGISRTHAIYGALAQLPSFLVWLYIGWGIILFTAQITCMLDTSPEEKPAEEELKC